MAIESKENIVVEAQKVYDKNKQLVSKLKKKKPKDLDNFVSNYNDEEFERIDCLNCANCCKTISPIITDQDVKRLSKTLKLKQDKFIEQYLYVDEDGDYVFQQTPCPFLMDDNYCFVYEDRPKACREYPHTDRKRFYQILNLSLKNVEVCPIVFNVFEKLRKKYIG
jgi:Fe-S-cluster containining protein